MKSLISSLFGIIINIVFIIVLVCIVLAFLVCCYTTFSNPFTGIGFKILWFFGGILGMALSFAFTILIFGFIYVILDIRDSLKVIQVYTSNLTVLNPQGQNPARTR